MRKAVEVIPTKRTNVLSETYTYLVPENLETSIAPGSVVQIPFGKDKLSGVVKSVEEYVESNYKKYKLKSILSVESNFSIPKKYLSITEYVSEYFLCSLGEATGLFMPPKIKIPRKSVILETKNDFKETILTKNQQSTYEQIIKAEKPVLLHGVTGSGKTEIYIKLIQETIKNGKQAVLLVPEIMLATQTISKIKDYFHGDIALYHSGLSDSEKYNAYVGFNSKKYSVLLGPRSALTIPSDNIGLIIVDEEHDDAYKQESNPRYHAISLALNIAKTYGAKLVLGSATPRIEDFYKSKLGKFELVELKSRYNQLLLPPSQIIDLKKEMQSGNYSPISKNLREGIQKVLSEKKQIILLLNRLGMATFVSCRDCGEVIKCPNCEIPLVYHLDDRSGILSCHHCDFKKPDPKVCPKCQSLKIKYYGSGIDKIEVELRSIFPKARIKKVNSKIMENKDAYKEFYNDVIHQKIDIILGTQIVAKGLDFPSVDLVGIVSADTGLHLPQYQSSEKIFQLLTQVSGRSGRKHNSGFTIIQSYWPDSTPIMTASTHDYQAFYESEILERKKHSYPPFSRLIRIISEDKNKEKAKEKIDHISSELKKLDFDFIGPGECFFSRLHNRHRYHIIIKLKQLPDAKIQEIFEKNQYLIWDVEPTNLL